MIGCSAYPDPLSGEKCGEPATHLVLAGCKHEHITEVSNCAEHVEIAKACHACFLAGCYPCQRTTIRIRPIITGTKMEVLR